MLDPSLKALDVDLVKAASRIHVLSHITWPAHVREDFLDRWRRGDARLPEVDYRRVDLDDTMRELERIEQAAAREPSPAGVFISETARSYRQIASLMAHAGTAAAGEISIEIYGKPGNLIPGSNRTNVDAARYFVEVSREYLRTHASDLEAYRLPASEVADAIRRRLRSVITHDAIDVVVDPNLASKAAAGATRIRLRGGTHFSEYDIEQLLQHEAFVHSLTALNGRRQPHLSSLSLGSPRTTAAQEGLATFAELVTGAIDIARMERIAMRISAIDDALAGADFIQVFETFLAAGQIELESFNSAMRVYRGVPLEGGSAFTKDVVYLTGLLEVHTFFRWALTQQKLEACQRLFAGRMRLADVFALESEFHSGVIAPATYLPPWMVRTTGLTAYLAFSVFANEIVVGEVHTGAFSV